MLRLGLARHRLALAAPRVLAASSSARGRGLSTLEEAVGRRVVVEAGSDGEEFRAQHSITLHGALGEVDTTPAETFDDLVRTDAQGTEHSLPSKVVQFLRSKRYEQPTPIQAQALPVALAGHDVVGVAQTGSGKTMGFLLPLFWEVAAARADPKNKIGPLAVVLAPTRELAQQIEAEAAPLAKAFNCSTLCVFGGQPRHVQERQIARMRRKLDLVVGTPGRLSDFIRDGTLPMHGVRFLVLDEADRMLDMGFEPQLREISETLPAAGPADPADPLAAAAALAGRQTLMFSATWPKEVRELANEFQHRPVRIHIGGHDTLVANRDIAQHVQLHETTLSKLESLNSLVEGMAARDGVRGCHTVIFVARKRDVDMVAEDVRDATGLRAMALHGDLSQNQRDRVLYAVKQGRAPVLVATDVRLEIAGSHRASTGWLTHDGGHFSHRWPPADSTSRPSARSSTSTCPPTSRTTCTASGAPAARARRASRTASCTRRMMSHS